MRILHLFGNWKWTGPAEPAINLAWEQQKRHQVQVVVGRCPYDDLQHLVAVEARRRGLEVLEVPDLQKHLSPLRALRAARSVARLLGSAPVDVLHVHLDADHVVAALARRKQPQPILVRTLHEPTLALRSPRRRWLLRRTDGLLVISKRLAADLGQLAAPWADRVSVLPGAVDLDRFRPRRARKSELRRGLGWPEGAILAGIVARVQKHRRYETLLRAVALARQQVPRLELVILGRGTFADQIAGATAEQLGLSSVVHRPGYLEGERYVDALAALDFAVFLVPGTDGSCRAVREELAMGLPVIAAPVDPLPEIVVHREHGLIAAVEPRELALALVALAGDGALRERLAAQALTHARAEFSLARQAEVVDALYRKAVDARGRRP
jgi:glycosyltransferase involved in cell wall biosynthesis